MKCIGGKNREGCGNEKPDIEFSKVYKNTCLDCINKLRRSRYDKRENHIEEINKWISISWGKHDSVS